MIWLIKQVINNLLNYTFETKNAGQVLAYAGLIGWPEDQLKEALRVLT